MSDSSKINSETYFLPLDVIRFICALMVILYHTLNWSNPDKPYHTFIGNLSYGVEIFFLLSGFLITYILINEKYNYGSINLKKFYYKRVLRIFPLYYLAVIMAPLIYFFYGEGEPNYYYQVFFLGNFELIKNGSWGSTAINHLWSLCIEEHFYIVWPLLIIFTPFKRLPYIFAFLISISIVFRGYTFLFTQWGGWFSLFLHTLSRWDTLAIGGMLAYAYYFKSFSLKTTWVQRLPFYVIFTGAFVLLDYRDWSSLFNALFSKYIFLLVPVFAIGNILFNDNSIIKFNTYTFLHYLGRISFGLYIYHPFAIIFLIRNCHLKENSYYFVFPVIALTIIMATISYHFFERPILSLKTKLFNRTKTQVRELGAV